MRRKAAKIPEAAWHMPAEKRPLRVAALAQAESHFRSENIKFGIRHRMTSGKTVLNHTQFLGYPKGPDGILQIVPEEAEIVRKIFGLYIQGNGVRKIRQYLEEHGIKTVTGKSEWSTSTIDRMLSNGCGKIPLNQQSLDTSGVALI